MNENSSAALKRSAETGLKKCLARLSSVSAGTWEILGVSVSRGTLEDAVKHHDFKNRAAMVYFNIGGLPPTAAMLFDPGGIECISKCFMGYSFPRGEVTTQAEEVMLLELGNIILNSALNSALNAFKKSGIPSVPAYLEGNLSRLLGGLGAGAGVEKYLHVIAATLAIRSDKCEVRSEVLVLVPEELAWELPVS